MRELEYVAAGSVVFDDGGRVLVLDRPSRGEVRLPKGHVDHGESVRAAARRETAEEAGFDDIEVLGDLGAQVVTFEYAGATYRRIERYFACRLISARQVPRGRKDERQFFPMWLPADAASARLSYEPEREWVRRALAWLAQHEQGADVGLPRIDGSGRHEELPSRPS